MLSWFKSQAPKDEPKQPRASLFSTHALDHGAPVVKAADVVAQLTAMQPQMPASGAQDDSGGGPSLKMTQGAFGMPEVLASWYASQSFIGHQMCAILAQHWLIDKACSMPGRDAIRQGFDVLSQDGDEVNAGVVKLLKRYDRTMRLRWNLEQFARMGRIFGIRIALFSVDSTDPEYYEKPFNLDGVTPGSYKGIVQVDPYWTAPELDANAASRPETIHFYEPTYWIISGKRYHRSHLIIFRNSEPADLLKPQYLYGGVPVPQQIMERVYAAERTANEAPQLAMTKRTNVWLTDMAKFASLGDEAIQRIQQWSYFRDNFGVKLGDKEGDEFQQFDTALTDLDQVIMTQYQIVAAAARVPATKLLGTTPKGFNATGEYEESSYHEELESLQEHDLTPFIERHHALVMRSFVKAELQVTTTVAWRPLDSPTAKELADTNLVKAQTGAALIGAGALTGEDERRRIATDPDGGYHDLGLDDLPDPLGDDDE